MKRATFEARVGELIRRECSDTGLALDLGSGFARYHEHYRTPVIGVDLRRLGSGVVGDAEHLPFCDGTFTFATSFQCLYYVGDVRIATGELHRVMASGATAIVSVADSIRLIRERRAGNSIPRIHTRSGWSRIWEEAGFRVSGLSLPPWHPGTGGSLDWVFQFVSPYLLYRLVKTAEYVPVPG